MTPVSLSVTRQQVGQDLWETAVSQSLLNKELSILFLSVWFYTDQKQQRNTFALISPRVKI